MPDPLDVSPDAARFNENTTGPDSPDLDPTGITPIMEIIGTAWQIFTAARTWGFSEAQAFALAQSWFVTMNQLSAERGG